MKGRLMQYFALSAAAMYLAAVCAGASFAQTSRGTVTGLVADPKGAVIPGATVELMNKDTNQTRTSTTNESGLYRFDAVDLGQYDLKISATGFKPYISKDIGIQANRVATFDVRLEVGVGEVVVEVNASSEEMLQKSEPVRGGNFNRQEVVLLPLGALNPIALARLLPGVTQPTGTSTFGNGGSSTQFAVNGQRPRGNNYLLDGTENNDISVGGPAHTVTITDGVAEFSAQTGLFSAEFGRAGGGIFNVITKSGTNGYHGTASELLLSQAFNALTNGQRVAGLTKPSVFTENIFGGTFGGPLIKNKTFFFGGVQWDRFRTSGNSTAFTIPTAAGRARLRQLFPAGSNPRVDTYLTAFEGLDGLTNITNIALGPDPVTNVDRGNIEFGRRGIPFSEVSNDSQFLIRIDHSIGEKHKLAFRYVFDDSIDTPNGVNGPGFTTDFNGRDQNFLLTHTMVINPTWTNEFRFSYGRIGFFFPLTPANKALATTLPNIAIGGVSTFGIATNIPQYRIANNWLYQDTMSKVVRSHTFRFGVEFLRQLAGQHPPFNERGSFSFLTSPGRTAFANFVDNFSGQRGNTNRNFGDPIYYPNLFRQSYFFQDTWKARQSLTLTLGLRYENFGQPANGAFKFPAFAGFDPALFLVPNKVDTDNNNFGPVVGFAWSPSFSSGLLHRMFGEGKTVWRGGFQVSYDSFFNNLLSNIAADSPNTISTTFTDTSTGNSRGTAIFFPNFLPTTARVPTPLDSQTSVFNKNIRNPYTERFSFGFQRELPASMFMELSYVGSMSHKLFVSEVVNPLVGGTVRLYPSLGPRTYRSNSGNSNYHGLQLRVDRRFAHGFQINGSYTWSRFIDSISEVFATTNSNTSLASVPVYRGGLRLDRAVSDYDRTHRATIAYIWEIPGFKRGVFGQVLGGWQIAGITTFQSGAPYTLILGADRDGDGSSGGDRPDVGNPNAPHNTRAILSSASPTGYRNPDTGQNVSPGDVYVIQANGFPGPGTLGRNTERSHGVNNFDWSLLKYFRLTVSWRLEYRLETFNIFNHPQFTGVPGQNVISSTAGSFGNFNLITGGGRTMRMGLKLIF